MNPYYGASSILILMFGNIEKCFRDIRKKLFIYINYPDYIGMENDTVLVIHYFLCTYVCTYVYDYTFQFNLNSAVVSHNLLDMTLF